MALRPYIERTTIIVDVYHRAGQEITLRDALEGVDEGTVVLRTRHFVPESVSPEVLVREGITKTRLLGEDRLR